MKHTDAVRLTFEYDAAGVRLIDRTPVRKPVRPDAGDAAPSADGMKVELRDGEGRPVYTAVIPDAVPLDTEVFDPSVDRGVYRIPVPPPSGVFAAIVPADVPAEEAVLVAGPILADHPAIRAAVAAVPAAPAAAMVRAGGRDQRGPVVVGRFKLD